MDPRSGNSLDIQNVLSKLPFSTTKIPGEMHYIINGKPASFAGPGTRLDLRLDENGHPKPWSKPVNSTDEACMKHDINYEKAGTDLNKKHEADKILLQDLEAIQPNTFSEKIMKFIIDKIIKLKLSFGLGLESHQPKDGSEAHQRAIELHKPIRHKFDRRKVIVNEIDEIFAADLMDFSKEPLKQGSYVLVVIDVFSKYCWIEYMKNKNIDSCIDAFKKVFKERKPKLLWMDQERSVDSKRFGEFLTEYQVKLYHTFSEVKVSVVERMIRTLKEKAERMKTEFGSFNLKQIVEEYNKTIHRTTKMTPIDGSKKSNEKELQKLYQKKYKDYQPNDGPKFKINDRVRIYRYKGIFQKGVKARWTDEIFYIAKINNTKPITYELIDEKKEPIIGCFYSYELQKSLL